MTTLEEAISSGQGVERPFMCPEGEHGHDTASVNVLKGLWVCYSCSAKGVVDSTRVPTASELEAMLQPEESVRHYAEGWLSIFGTGGYWRGRFPAWLCWAMSLGEDPWSGEGVFPVHTPGGSLAGVGRRAIDPGPNQPRYRYPRSWSASRTLFGTRGIWQRTDVVLLTEGAADTTAMREVGVDSFAVYGAGVHAPQVELIARMQPRIILAGFDKDDAGARATEQAVERLTEIAPVLTVDWGEAKDPTELEPGERLDAVLRTVTPRTYGLSIDEVKTGWKAKVAFVKERYDKEQG